MKILLFVFAFACSIALPSVALAQGGQTTVCSGDSVILVLNGYKQGQIYWKQSTDRTTWDNAIGTKYNDSFLVIVTNTLYYRAFILDGTCSPFHSDTTLVIVNPTPPIAKPASDITQTSFTANWSGSIGSTIYYYYLDVATNAAFTSFVPGKKNIEVYADTTYSIAGLDCNSTYYYRVRALDQNCGDTGITSANSNTITVTTDSCPPPVTCGIITDSRDGKTYKTIIIGTQCWMAQNLNVGTAIPGEVAQTPGIIEKYCYDYKYSNLDSSKCATYGGLYMWNEMMAYGQSASGYTKVQGICPTGWHIPTDDEWTLLVETLGGAAVAGGKLKKDTSLWTYHANGGATNSSGFSALPGGYRLITAIGTFANVGNVAYLWSATEFDATSAWFRILGLNSAGVGRVNYSKVYYGFSVRCVKD